MLSFVKVLILSFVGGVPATFGIPPLSLAYKSIQQVG